MKEDNTSQSGDYDAHSVHNNTRMGLVISLDYDAHSVHNNTRMGLVISLCSNSNHLISLIPPKLPQILDIYSVVAL